MYTHFESLETRRFFSGTLAIDQATVTSDAAALKTATAALFTTLTADTKTITTDFKGTPKADAALLKALKSDESKYKSLLNKSEGLLGTPAKSLASKSVSEGNVVLKKATTASLTALAKDITALGNVTDVPVTDLEDDLNITSVSDDLSEIFYALPDDDALNSAVDTADNDLSNNLSNVGTDAYNLQSDIETLQSDLTTVQTTYGTFPVVEDTYTGSALVTSGKSKGQSEDVTLIISSESSDGVLTGSVTDLSGTYIPVTGSITLNGVVALKSNPGAPSGKIAGTYDANTDTLTGKFSFSGGGGTFSVIGSF